MAQEPAAGEIQISYQTDTKAKFDVARNRPQGLTAGWIRCRDRLTMMEIIPVAQKARGQDMS